MRKRPTRILRLDDGRRLEYAEFGDAKGVAVIYFHGCFGSCHQAALLHAQALEQGIRIIAPNRPGIGRSTPRMFVSMMEYVADIGALADKLALRSFAVMGASGGGGFALASAYALAGRACMVGVAGGLGPLAHGRNFRDLRWYRRHVIASCRSYPRLAALALAVVFYGCRQHPEWLYSRLKWASSLIAPDPAMRRLMEQVLRWDFREVFLQPGGAMGLLNEVNLYFRWGFRPRNFPAHIPVLSWHGREDSVVPLSIGQRTSRAFPTATPIIYTGGHLVFLTKLRDIFTTVKRELERPPRALIPI